MTEDDLIEVGRVICDAYERYAPVPAVLRSEAPNIARALADFGLLADPAQTTELEELREQRHGLWELLKKSIRVTQVVLSTKIPRWDEDNVVAKFGWREGRCGKCGEDLPVTTEDRDRLSLLLRGMARKLVATRAELEQEKCDGTWVLNRIRRSLGTPDGRSVSVHAREVGAERDTLRIDFNSSEEDLTDARRDRDLALWLHAEAEWWLSQYKYDVALWKRQVDDLAAERDERQARLDEIADVLGRAPGDATSAEIVEIVRTAVAVKGRRRDEAMELRARIDAALAHLETRTRALASDLVYANERDTIRFVRAALAGDQPAVEPCHCGGRRWVEDKNWSPQYPELWKGERSPGDGLVPCGSCNFGGWDVDPVEPEPAHAALVGDQPKHKTEGGMCCNGKRGCGGPGSYCCSQTVYLHRHADGSRGPFPIPATLPGVALRDVEEADDDD
jgi:hypothetical protein